MRRRPKHDAGTTRSWGAATLAMLLAVVGTSCASGVARLEPLDVGRVVMADPTTTTTAAAAPSTTIPVPVEEQVRSAYLDAEALYADAYQDERAGTDVLEGRFVDPLLTEITATVERVRAAGIRVEYRDGRPPPTTVESVTVDPVGTTAVVRTCVIDDAIQVRLTDGQVVDDTVVSQRQDVTMVRTPDGWKAQRRTVVTEWPGPTGCP